MLGRIVRFIARLLGAAPEIPSPPGLIEWDNIEALRMGRTADLVIKNLPLPLWVFSNPWDTNSMDGAYDLGHAPILVSNPAFIRDNIQVGAWISWRQEAIGRFHQVVEEGSDDKGWFCKTSGINIEATDPWKVRLSDIDGIAVGILWTKLLKDKVIYIT